MKHSTSRRSMLTGSSPELIERLKRMTIFGVPVLDEHGYVRGREVAAAIRSMDDGRDPASVRERN